MGRLYENGIGVDRNYQNAIIKYSEAAIQNESYGYYMLGKMTEEGKNPEFADEESAMKQAYNLYKKAYSLNDCSALVTFKLA